jgi:hypothetical protein
VFGWGYSGTFGDPPLVTGLAENVTMLVTPPGGDERFAFRQVVLCSVCSIYGVDEFM